MLRASGEDRTYSLSGILSNTQNKFLLAGFQSVATTWQRVAAVASARDFKPMASYRLIAKGELAKVPNGGMLQNLGLADQTFKNQAETYGAMVGLSRQDIINDDMSALSGLPSALGRLSGIRLEKSVYELLLSSPSNFFGTGNANYHSGATSALSISRISPTPMRGSSRCSQ